MKDSNYDRSTMENFLVLIEVIKDPEKYEKAVGELAYQYKKVADMVEKVGPAKEIERLRSQAHADSAVATKQVCDAKAKAKTILDNAHKLINRKNEDVEARLAAVGDKEKALMQKISDESSRVDALEKKAEATLKEADRKFAEAQHMLKEGQQLKAEFEERMRKLREAAQ